MLLQPFGLVLITSACITLTAVTTLRSDASSVDICATVKCTELLECPSDSHVVTIMPRKKFNKNNEGGAIFVETNKKDNDNDFVYDEIKERDDEEAVTSNPFAGIRIESLDNSEEYSTNLVPAENDHSNMDDAETIDVTTDNTPLSTSKHLQLNRHRRSALHINLLTLRSTTELSITNVPHQKKPTISECCLQYRCKCAPCPTLQCGANETLVIKPSNVSYKTIGTPGNCCEEQTCLPQLRCDSTDSVDKRSYWRNNCTKCSCFGVEEFCQNHCPTNDDIGDSDVIISSSKNKNCFSEYLQRPMLNGAVWWEDGYCTECRCIEGHPDCIESLCIPVPCDKPLIKLNGTCCSICPNESNTLTTRKTLTTILEPISQPFSQNITIMKNDENISILSVTSLVPIIFSTSTSVPIFGSTDTTFNLESNTEVASTTSLPSNTDTTNIEKINESTLSSKELSMTKNINTTSTTVISSPSSINNTDIVNTTNFAENSNSVHGITDEIISDEKDITKTSTDKAIATKTDSTTPLMSTSILVTTIPYESTTLMISKNNIPTGSEVTHSGSDYIKNDIDTNTIRTKNIFPKNNVPIPLEPPQPTSYRHNDLLTTNDKAAKATGRHNENYIDNIDFRYDENHIVNNNIGNSFSAYIIFGIFTAFIIVTIAYFIRTKSKLYSSIPNSEISLSQAFSNCNV